MKQNARSKWYQKSVEEVLTQLQTDGHGITTDDVVERHKTFGYNSLEFKKPSVFARFVRQFNNPLVFILLAAFAMTLGLTFSGADMLVDSAVIMGVVILNAVLGFFQEGKAENALQALKEMIVPECTVRRDGKVSIIPTRDLVPGDLVLLEGGDKIPADLRLINVREAAADESVLTGESVTVEKHTEALEGENLSPGDQICMAFGGTFLARGTATGVVVEIGEGTEFGKIAALVKHTKTVLTPLQKKIAVFTKTLIIAIISLGLVNFVLGAFFGYSLVYSFLASVSLVVAAIPEMLPMIVTAILALAATAMARRNALIRRLPAAETLGCTTVICSDKTGTLTKNEMTVTRLYAAGRTYELSGVGYSPHGELSQAGAIISENVLGEPLRETLLAGALCNNAIVKEDGVHYKMIGDPTEGALVTSAMKVLVTPELDRLDDIPFESGNMYMATLHQAKNENVIYLKGSPERVLDMCSTQLGDDGMVPLDHPAFTQAANEMADAALRVIGMAMKKVPADKTTLSHEDLSDFVFAGLQGMIDPPREEAVVAIERCRGAGIRTVMITGDHMLTARAISRELGIIHGDDNRVLAGQELAEMSDAELSDAVEEHSVFARVAPEHKLRIAQSLQGGGHVVAMTGDGVNDAPALKAADIGVAMGITGTAVSKEASSMVLTDDNFATIVGAVEEGRHAWNSLEKAILFTLPTNGGQALLVMGAVLLAPFIPLFG
ncbi:MAG: HAD-IC family P-type ATPase, partial [Rhodospirillales bacterium]|nr:HAD-IC family P-type ATPase [Rhodospirillales bacterium]